MKLKRIVATAAFGGAVAAAAFGVGAGIAQADLKGPPGPPWVPGNGDWGPGANVGRPGNPLPPGQGYLPPPGHRGDYDDIIPVWAPPPPRPPVWAPWLPVVWNGDLPGWGVWWNGGFIQL